MLSLDLSESANKCLTEMRVKGRFEPKFFNSLSPDEKTYLLAEWNVRNDHYQIENEIPKEASTSVRMLAKIYCELFENPVHALKNLSELFEKETLTPILQRRLSIWNANLNIICGNLEKGKNLLKSIDPPSRNDGLWAIEFAAIFALDSYLLGNAEDAIHWHRTCQDFADVNPDIFLETFNSAMALRTAAKLCDPASFEFFNARLENCLVQKKESRYQLRLTGYRAIVLNQLGEHELAERYWLKGDDLLPSSQMAWEKAQYLILRSLAYALTNQLVQSRLAIAAAKKEFKAAGSPAPYLVELDLAYILAPIANPLTRGKYLEQSLNTVRKATRWLAKRKLKVSQEFKGFYDEAIEFCHALLKGTAPNNHTSPRPWSIVLSIIQNVQDKRHFASGVRHFRMIPRFLQSLEKNGLSEPGLCEAISEATGVRPQVKLGSFQINFESEVFNNNPDIQTLLNLSTILLKLKEKAEEAATSNALSQIATQVAHDIRSPLSALALTLKFATNFPEEVRELAENAINRIHEIANGLLRNQNRKQNLILPETENSVEMEYKEILNYITEIVMEKKFQLGPKSDINIVFVTPTVHGNPKLQMVPIEFKRILSNLINNSIEAMQGAGDITVSVSVNPKAFEVTVKDTGVGMPQNVLLSIGKTGNSYGKKSGFGLGLSHAHKRVREWGGSLLVSSEIKKGTSVKMQFPYLDNSIAPL